MPRRELVGEPLSITRPRRSPNRARVDERVCEIEAAVPLAVALNGAVDRGRVRHAAAEARRANQRAVATGKTATGDVIPPRMPQVVRKKSPDIARVELPLDAAGGPFEHGVPGGEVGWLSRRTAGFLGDLGSPLRSDPDEVLGLARRRELGQRQVIAGLDPVRDPGPGAHRGAETRACRRPALRDDDERRRSSIAVVRIRYLSPGEHTVKHAQPRQIAGTRPDECHRGAVFLRLLECHHVAGRGRTPDQGASRIELRLRGSRSDGPCEKRRVIVVVKPVVTRRLLVMPALGEVAGARNLPLNNRTIAHDRADSSVAASCERSEQPVKTGAVHYNRSAEVHELHNMQFGRPLVRAEGPVFVRVATVAVVARAFAKPILGSRPPAEPARRSENGNKGRVTQEQWTAVDRYLNNLLVPSDPALDAALEASADAGLPAINVAPNQGKLLNLLVLASSARTVLEIGTLGAYSTIWLARALPASGRLVTLETDPRHAAVARENIAGAGLSEVVEILVGPAAESLPKLKAQHRPPFDLVFIDADKPATAEYFAWSLEMSHVGTLIVVDNVVRRGQVIESGSDDQNVQGMRRFLDQLASETRVSATAIQTVGVKGYDGFVLALVTAEAQ